MSDTTMKGTWKTTDYTDLLAGLGAPAMLRKMDRRGMTPGYAAALEAAEKTALLMALLDMASSTEGESALDRIETLLTEQVEMQKVMLERLNALVSLLSSRNEREQAFDAAKERANIAVPHRRFSPRENSERKMRTSKLPSD